MFSEMVEKDGLAIILGVFCAEEILSVLEHLRGAQLRRTRAGIRHLMSDSRVAMLANDPRLLSIASEVLGRHAFPFRATLFDKSPDAQLLSAASIPPDQWAGDRQNWQHHAEECRENARGQAENVAGMELAVSVPI